MDIIHESLMDLTVIDGEVRCQGGGEFDRTAYSRFKYGYLPPATGYGEGLAALIADRLFDLAGSGRIIIVSAPYKFLPTASHAIAQTLLKALSHHAVQKGLEPPVLVPFHKARTGSSSYARSSEADRLKSLETLGLHIDESLIPGAHVIAVDDIRITGSAERATAGYLEPLGPASLWYLHAASLSEEIGRAYPGMEDELNQTVEHSLEGFLRQAENGHFRLNTRVLRFILETTDPEAFGTFIDGAPSSLVQEIYGSGVGSGLNYYEKYRLNLEVVFGQLRSRAEFRSAHSICVSS